MTDEIVFGTDILQNDISKLIHLCEAVTGGKIPNDKYTWKRLSSIVTTNDRSIIDFFNKELGTKRRVVTFLISAGLRRMYSQLGTYPTSFYQMEQLLAAISNTDGLYYILLDDNKLKLSLSNSETIKEYHIEIPIELWGLLCSIGKDLGVYPKHILMYLIRVGICEYNDFVKSFSSPIKIRSWMLKFSKKSSDIFLHTIRRLYRQRLIIILDLYEECKSTKKPYSEEVKELMSEMEQIKKENKM